MDFIYYSYTSPILNYWFQQLLRYVFVHAAVLVPVLASILGGYYCAPWVHDISPQPTRRKPTRRSHLAASHLAASQLVADQLAHNDTSP
jgi:hypothetical protein